MSTYRAVLDRIRAEVAEVDPRQAHARQSAGALLLDVRETDEIAQGHIPGAELIPRGHLELRAESRLPTREREIIVYCAAGVRSLFAARSLWELGYSRVSSMRGGLGRWKREGLPVVVPRSLSAEQRQRYSRHLLVPEVGASTARAIVRVSWRAASWNSWAVPITR